MEGQGFRDRAPEFEALDAEVLGASFDPPEVNRAFAKKFQLPFKLLSDRDRSVGARYEVRRGPDEKYASTPRRMTYLIDPEGVVRRAYRVRDIEPHPIEVLEDLRRLRVG
jgi:thioredoxin-dependent peroxiredoxin